MKFCSLIRPAPHYRADAFRRGLQALGGVESDYRDCDVLLIWNRYGTFAQCAADADRRGATVLVAENGYLGNDFRGDRWYAISRGQHNGAGWWPVGGPERWDSLGVELAPFREGGREIVLLPQRGIGAPGVAMPSRWPQDALRQVGSLVKRPARVRPHPGKHIDTAVPLEADLADAWAAVVWGSGAGIKALAVGVPVFHAMPQWIGAPASRPLERMAEGPLRTEAARLAMFRRLIWAQWLLSEIESGEAFSRLLGA